MDLTGLADIAGSINLDRHKVNLSADPGDLNQSARALIFSPSLQTNNLALPIVTDQYFDVDRAIFDYDENRDRAGQILVKPREAEVALMELVSFWLPHFALRF